MLTSSRVVSGDLLANAEILPTNATAPGAAIKPIWRYNSLISGAGAPAAGSTLGFGSGLVRDVELLQAIATADPTRRRPEQTLDVIGITGKYPIRLLWFLLASRRVPRTDGRYPCCRLSNQKRGRGRRDIRRPPRWRCRLWPRC